MVRERVDAPGLAPRYGDPGLPATITEIAIGMFPGDGAPPVFPYLGRVVAVDGYLDLAIVAIDRKYTGEPVAAGSISVPAVPLSSATIGAGRPVVVTVEPQGNEAVAATTTESTTDPRIAPRTAELVTDVPLPDGAWPGQTLILDPTGALVAFPSFSILGRPASVRGRPYPLIGPLLDAARGGTPYVSPYVVAGTGRERLDFDAWVLETSPCDQPQVTRVAAYRSGATEIVALFAASEFTQDEDYLWTWYDADAYIVTSTGSNRWKGSGAQCHSFSQTAPPGGSLPDGRYGLAVFAGGKLRLVSLVEATVGDQAAGTGALTVQGRVADADTGSPIEGAFFFLLKPGVDVAAWFNARTIRRSRPRV
jgi:hypothetical protein